MKGLSRKTFNIFWRRKCQHDLHKTEEAMEGKDTCITHTLARQSFLALGPLLLTIAIGMTSGYSAILLPQLQSDNNSYIKIDSEDASWIASMAALPMALGSILGGVFIEKFGRKCTHILTCLPTLIGWMLIYLASDMKMILYGRFITGITSGILGSATGIYIGESSEPKYRGFLLAGISLAIALGLLFIHILGTFLSWQTTALVTAAVPAISLVVILFVPESPYWLAKKGKIDKAEKSFYWCRGYSESAKAELATVLQRQEIEAKEDSRNFGEKFEDLLVPEFLKPLIIIVVYIVANQWAGVNALTFYTVSIMKDTIGENVNEYVATLLVDIIRVLMSTLACVLLRRYGRRPLAMVSGIGTFSSLFVLSSFTYVVKLHPLLATESYIPMTALVMYISFISIGFVPLPWALIGELFPLKSRSIGSVISSFMAFTAFFSVVKTSPSMFERLNTSGTFLVYGIVAFVGTVFVFFCLPETKGKRLHEIEDSFKRKRCITESQNSDKYNDNVNNSSQI